MNILGGKNMKNIIIILLILALGNIAYSCSPKQIWIPVVLLNLQSENKIIGENGGNYIYRIKINGTFQPATKGVELQCGTECCDIYESVGNYKISYCIDEPCGCSSTMTMPSKCEDMPMQNFCDPLQGIACSGPYFHPFQSLRGSVYDPGLKGGCPTGKSNSCKDTDIGELWFEGEFEYERAKDASYPYTLNVKVCVVDGLRGSGSCRNEPVILQEPCFCCPPDCDPPCTPLPPEQCDDGGGGNGDCKGKLRISSNGWLKIRVLKQGVEVVPWTYISNVNTNPALKANGPVSYELDCGYYDIEYNEDDEWEEGNEVCWTPGRHIKVRKDQTTDVSANKREWHWHIKFRDGHYQPHSPEECPYRDTVCVK